jgi:hypothetical protein
LIFAENFQQRRGWNRRGLWRRFLFFFAGVAFFMPPKPSQTGGDGAIGTGAGFGAGFFFFFAFIPFFLRAGPPRFAVLDFFATFNVPIGSTKIMPIPYHTATMTIGLACRIYSGGRRKLRSV